jgi:nicotinate-nucleotide adenylyltransferase
MCTLAVASFQKDLVKVLSLERERQGTSWTIDTVQYLIQHYPDFDFTWIIGSDVLSELNKWKDFDQLQRLIAFLVVPRAGAFQKTSPANSEANVSPFWKEHRVMQQLQQQCQELEEQGLVLPNVSSSSIRERVKQQQPIHYLVPRAVKEYIYTHKLYLR